MTDKIGIRLRAIEPEDLDLLYQIENDVELWNVGETNVPYSRFLLRNYIANTVADIYTDKQLRLIVEREDGAVIGIADLVEFNPQHLRAEIGIVIISQYRHQGYGTMVLRKLMEYSSSILHLHQLYAFISASNTPSLHLFRKLGFAESAVLKDWLMGASSFQDAVLVTRVLTPLTP